MHVYRYLTNFRKSVETAILSPRRKILLPMSSRLVRHVRNASVAVILTAVPFTKGPTCAPLVPTLVVVQVHPGKSTRVCAKTAAS